MRGRGAARGPGFPRALGTAVLKAASLRAVRGAAAAALLVPPALALASGLAADPSRTAALPSASRGFETAGFGQALIILLAALIAGAEYRDGQLYRTLLAVPRRGRALAATLALVAGLAGIIGMAGVGAAVLISHATRGPQGIAPGEWTAAMMLNLLGVGLNYALMALIAAALTILARGPVLALVALVPLVLGLTISLLGVLPALRFLPDLAGIQLLMPYPGIGLLEAGPGALVMALWAAGLTALAATAWSLRDEGGGAGG